MMSVIAPPTFSSFAPIIKQFASSARWLYPRGPTGVNQLLKKKSPEWQDLNLRPPRPERRALPHSFEKCFTNCRGVLGPFVVFRARDVKRLLLIYIGKLAVSQIVYVQPP
jgi:hypothetical protein